MQPSFTLRSAEELPEPSPVPTPTTSGTATGSDNEPELHELVALLGGTVVR